MGSLPPSATGLTSPPPRGRRTPLLPLLLPQFFFSLRSGSVACPPTRVCTRRRTSGWGICAHACATTPARPRSSPSPAPSRRPQQKQAVPAGPTASPGSPAWLRFGSEVVDAERRARRGRRAAGAAGTSRRPSWQTTETARTCSQVASTTSALSGGRDGGRHAQDAERATVLAKHVPSRRGRRARGGLIPARGVNDVAAWLGSVHSLAGMDATRASLWFDRIYLAGAQPRPQTRTLVPKPAIS